jgi:hypothetical protein
LLTLLIILITMQTWDERKPMTMRRKKTTNSTWKHGPIFVTA